MQFEIRLAIFLKKNCGFQIVLHRLHSITVASYTNINANLQEDLFSMFAGAYRLSTINNIPLCMVKLKLQHPPRGIPQAFDCASRLERGEFERCLGRGGGVNLEFEQIYLLF